MMALLVGGIVSIIVTLLILVGVYVIQALAWKRMFEMCGHDKPWAAWIPIYNLIVMCECCDTDDVYLIGKIHIPMSIFKFWWVALLVSAFIPIVGPVLCFLICFLSMGWLYTMIFANAKGTTPNDELLAGWSSAINPLLGIILMFKIERVNTTVKTVPSQPVQRTVSEPVQTIPNYTQQAQRPTAPVQPMSQRAPMQVQGNTRKVPQSPEAKAAYERQLAQQNNSSPTGGVNLN